jgi:intein/homing endonuclease
LGELNIDKRKIYTKDFAYLIGSLLGDGCLYVGKNSYQFSITSEDYDFCEKCQIIVNNLFDKQGRIKTVKKNNSISYYQLIICSKQIVYFLKEITENKKKIPTFVYKNKEYKKAFCQGLMDSDGWISRVNASDGYIRYRVGFKNISCWTSEFKDILNSLGVRTGKMRKQSNIRSLKPAFTFTINTFDYCEKIGFRIDRKNKLKSEYKDGII